MFNFWPRFYTVHIYIVTFVCGFFFVWVEANWCCSYCLYIYLFGRWISVLCQDGRIGVPLAGLTLQMFYSFLNPWRRSQSESPGCHCLFVIFGCNYGWLYEASHSTIYSTIKTMYRIVYNLVDIPAEHHLNRTSLRTRGHSLWFLCTTHKNHVQCTGHNFSPSYTPLEPTTEKCGGSWHPRQLQGSAV